MQHAEKIEAAGVEYLKTKTWPVSINGRIFGGESNSTKDGQCVIFEMADMQEEFPLRTGNRYCLCEVAVRTPIVGDDPLTSHRTAADVLESAINEDDLAVQLTSAVDGFTAMGVLDVQPIQEQDENYYMTGFSFRLYSCPKAL